MAKNEEVELDAPKEQVFAAAAARTVADLGYSVLHSAGIFDVLTASVRLDRGRCRNGTHGLLLS